MFKRALYSFLRNAGYLVLKQPHGIKRLFPIEQFLNPGFDFENEAEECIALVRKNTMLSYQRLVTLYQQVLHCERNGIPGDYVECGVWKGGAVGLIALSNLKNSPKPRTLHLFDSFTDICQPNPEKDGQKALNEASLFSGISVSQITGETKPMDGYYTSFGGPGSEDQVITFLTEELNYPLDKIIVHKGWFQETLPTAKHKINTIALLRLDGDWYDSVKICLEYLYEKVVAGGVIVIDDYGAYEGCALATNEFRDKNGIKSYLHHIDNTGRYWIKGE